MSRKLRENPCAHTRTRKGLRIDLQYNGEQQAGGRIGYCNMIVVHRHAIHIYTISFIFDMGLPGVIDYLSREATQVFPK